MSCEDCKKHQEANIIIWYRWGAARIGIIACPKHGKEIIETLTFHQYASREGKVGLLLHAESWQNLFECLHQKGTVINSSGNFWAALQELERQFAELQDRGCTMTIKQLESKMHAACPYPCGVSSIGSSNLNTVQSGIEYALSWTYLDKRNKTHIHEVIMILTEVNDHNVNRFLFEQRQAMLAKSVAARIL